ncbi:homeobox-leucine zipper protein HOX9-like [Dioscorea cayenensis subsp. rotundata]|uniref:Homeobox-leucine zipper protein HOX9-like n=1 Tax=Dioscorea cayennensis subsp. rotundata TaxID=55577 RepID=A0AB40CEY5_DIOCR|nr:homeobox-leucine zipper protein HOX9-like [Dioscorea cayenensis subsp. rotundata]
MIPAYPRIFISCSGVDENAVGACYQLFFAPIDELFPDDAPILPSGFRVIPVEAKTNNLSSNHTSNQLCGDTSNTSGSRSVLTIVFQFPYEVHLSDCVAVMARQYVRSIVSAVRRVSLAISPSQHGLNMGRSLSLGSPEAHTLSTWICQSYTYHVVAELLRTNCETGES